MKLFVVVALLFFGTFASASETCKLFEYIQRSKLSENGEFWEKASALPPNNAKALTELISKFEKKSVDEIERAISSSSSVTSVAKTATPVVRKVEVRKNALKGTETTPGVKKKVEELIEVLESQEDALGRLSKGGWHLERSLREKDQWIVRLNHGHRAVFTLNGNTAQIVGVGNNLYRH